MIDKLYRVMGITALALILASCQSANPDVTATTLTLNPTTEPTSTSTLASVADDNTRTPSPSQHTPPAEIVSPSSTPMPTEDAHSFELPFSPQVVAQYENPDIRGPNLSPDGQFIVLNMNGFLYLYSAATLQQWWRAKFIGRVTWFPNGQHVAIGSIIYDILTGEQVKALPVEASSVAWSPDGTLAATFDDKGTMIVWDVASGLQIWNTLRPTEGFNLRDGTTFWLQINFSPQSDKIAVMYFHGSAEIQFSDGLVHIFEARTGEVITRLEGGEFAFFTTFSWSPDNRHLATYSCCETQRDPFTLWDVDTGEVITIGTAFTLVWSPDGSHFAVDLPGGVAVISTETGEVVLTLRRAGLISPRIRWSQDGTMLAAGDSDGSAVVIWSVDHSGRFYLLKDAGLLLGFGPDNQTLIAGLGRFYTIAVWDLNPQTP